MKRMIDDSVLFGIAEAIREKTDSTETFEVTEMAQAISEISGGDSSDFIGSIERNVTELTIPNGTTSIGDYAFRYCTSLTSITIPDSVTSIGYMAFSDCVSLVSVDLPDSLNCILVDAFSYCFSLTSIVIPASVTFIDEYTVDMESCRYNP